MNDSEWFERLVAAECEKRRRELRDDWRNLRWSILAIAALFILVGLVGCGPKQPSIDERVAVLEQAKALEKTSAEFAEASERLRLAAERLRAAAESLDEALKKRSEKEKGEETLSAIGQTYDLFYAACDCREEV